MKQRILALLLAAGLCLGLIAAAPALAFSDVSGEELSEAVEVLSGLGIVSGCSDGSYHPDDALTRAQFCKLAILTEGHGDQARGSAYRTRFSDVPGGGWAAPNINLACEEGLVAGYGDGRFGPDDPVTVGQAVTVVLRLLGYTAEEIGPFWPEDYLNKAGALGLLDGLPADGGAGLTRGDAALLLYRVLRQTDRDGQDYIDNLCASKVTGAVLLDNNAEAADGTLGTVEVYANQTISWYEPAEAVPDRLVGRKGALLLDEAGKAVGFLPDDSSHRTLRPAEVAADGITAAGGGTYAISSGTRVLLDGAVSTYGDCWYELEGREQVTLYYTDSGALDLVVASEAAAYEGVMLTGYYENASPNAASPASITLLGVELEVADGAAAGLSAFAVGDRITVTLNGAGEVISACAPSEKRAELYGVLQEDGVELTCGLTAAGELSVHGAGVGLSGVRWEPVCPGSVGRHPGEPSAVGGCEALRAGRLQRGGGNCPGGYSDGYRTRLPNRLLRHRRKREGLPPPAGRCDRERIYLRSADRRGADWGQRQHDLYQPNRLRGEQQRSQPGIYHGKDGQERNHGWHRGVVRGKGRGGCEPEEGRCEPG